MYGQGGLAGNIDAGGYARILRRALLWVAFIVIIVIDIRVENRFHVLGFA